MRRRELISSLLFFVFALIYTVESFSLPRGDIIKPGPGFLPLVLGVFLMALTAIYAWQTYRRSEDGEVKLEPIISKIAVLILLSIALFVFFLDTLGYILSATIMLIALFRITHFKNWAWSIGTAMIASLATWLVFVRLLQVQMPSGIIEPFLSFLY
ncbi:MAG: tripartite tricarboxylate transporter TctB family protein [Bacillota bacterium]